MLQKIIGVITISLLLTSCATPGGFFSGTFVLKVGEMNHSDKSGEKVLQEKAKYEWVFSVDRNVAAEQRDIAEKAKQKIISVRKQFRANTIDSEEYKKQSTLLITAMKNLEDKGREKQNDDGYNSLSVEKAFIDAWYEIRKLSQ